MASAGCGGCSSLRSVQLLLLLSSLPLAAAYFALPHLYLLKPAPVWACAAAAAASGTFYGRVIAVGLVFGSGGDLALEMKDAYGVDLFVPGLILFLTGHACYLRAFAWDAALHPAALKTGVPIGGVFYAVAMSFLFQKAPGYMVGPIGVYGLFIAVMAFFSFNRTFAAEVPAASRRAALLGALSFVASDTLLSFNKFYRSFEYAEYAVMVTYYLGQCGITASTLGCRRPPQPGPAGGGGGEGGGGGGGGGEEGAALHAELLFRSSSS